MWYVWMCGCEEDGRKIWMLSILMYEDIKDYKLNN